MCWMTKCFIFYCIAGRVNMTHHTTAKAHLSRTSRWWLSFQTWRIQWTNTTAACWAPPGTWAMKGRETHWQMCDSTALCPMGDSPVLAAGESMHTARHWAAPTHRHFVTRNKGAVQTSSFVYDWLRGFFAIGQDHSNGVCKCSDNVLLLHLCQYQKDALTGYLVRESSASNRMLLKARKLAWKHLTCQKTKVAFTKPLKVHPTSSEQWSHTHWRVLGCTIIIIWNSIFYFLACLRQCIFKFHNLTENMPFSKVSRDKAKIDMLI